MRPAARASAALLLIIAPAALAGCKARSWSALKPELSVHFTKLTGALATEGLRPCPSGAFVDGPVLEEGDLLGLARATDYVTTNDRGLPPACRNSHASRDVLDARNPFSPEGIRVSGGRKLLAAKGYAVVTTDGGDPPSAGGGGSASGRVVWIDGASGAATCATPWTAKNGDHVWVTVDKITGAQSDPKKKWEEELESQACAAIAGALGRR